MKWPALSECGSGAGSRTRSVRTTPLRDSRQPLQTTVNGAQRPQQLSTIPQVGTEIDAVQMRSQLNGLKALIDAVPAGPQGPPGVAGVAGAVGPTGPQGEPGPQGRRVRLDRKVPQGRKVSPENPAAHPEPMAARGLKARPVKSR